MKLTENEQEILKYLAANEKAVSGMTIRELAGSTYSSPAAIIRLCKKLNLEGFNELKYFIRDKHKKERMKGQNGLELTGVLSGCLAAFQNTLSSISPDDLTMAADCLAQDNNIYLYGRGLSYMPITYMYQMLLSVDRDCLCFIDPPLIYQAASQMGTDDVVFIASAGGSTEGVTKACRMAKANGAFVIALTADSGSFLAEHANLCFHCQAGIRYRNGIDITSRFTIMAVIDMILSCYFSKMNLSSQSDPSLYINQKNW